MVERFDVNWVFFQNLWWSGGLEAVVDVVDQLPASSSTFDHEEALAGIAGMREIFHNMAQQLSDASLGDPGGGTIPYNPSGEPLLISSEQQITRDTSPFGTVRLQIEIGSGQSACIEATKTDDVTLTYRSGFPGQSGDWQPMPEDETFYSGTMTVLATSTEADGNFSLNVTKVTEEDDCEEEEDPVDAPSGEVDDFPDLSCLDICEPTEFFRFLEQLAAWFQDALNSATGGG